MSKELVTSSDKDADKVELFSIDGKSYFITNKPRLNVALKTLKIQRDEGENAAMIFLMEKAVGAEAFEALMDYDDLDQTTLADIIQAATDVIFGDLEVPKEN